MHEQTALGRRVQAAHPGEQIAPWQLGRLLVGQHQGHLPSSAAGTFEDLEGARGERRQITS